MAYDPKDPASIAEMIAQRLQEVGEDDAELTAAMDALKSEKVQTIVTEAVAEVTEAYEKSKEETLMNTGTATNTTQANTNPNPASAQESMQQPQPQAATTANAEPTPEVIYLDKPMSRKRKLAIAGGFVAAGVAGFFLGNKFGPKVMGMFNNKFAGRSQVGSMPDAPALPEATATESFDAADGVNGAVEMSI